MLDFLLVLGQVPGTRFFLTFTEIFSVYSIALAAYTINRQYHLRTRFLSHMRIVYVMYSSRVLPGPVKRRVILPEHIDLIPLIRSDVENFQRRLEHQQRRARLIAERILQLGSSLRRPAGGAF
jgi:hypothetical protein